MSTRLGMGTAIGIGAESTWGTAVARTAWVRAVSAGLMVTPRKTPRPDLYGSSVGTRIKHLIEASDCGGDIEWIGGYEGQGLLLKHALWGTPSTTGPVSGIYTHTYPLGASVPDGLTIEVVRGTDSTGTNVSRIYEGCLIDEWEASVQAGGYLRCRASIIGETGASDATAGTVSFTSNEIDLAHAQAGAFTWNSVANTGIVRSLTWRLRNSLARRNNLGSTLTAKPQPSDFRAVEVEVDMEQADAAMLDALTADTEAAGSIAFSGTGSRTWTLNLHGAYVDSVSDEISAPGILRQKVKLIGQFTSGSSFGMSVVVANTQSSAVAA